MSDKIKIGDWVYEIFGDKITDKDLPFILHKDLIDSGDVTFELLVKYKPIERSVVVISEGEYKGCQAVVLSHDEDTGFTMLGNLSIDSTRFLYLNDKLSPIAHPLSDTEFKLFRIFNEMQDKLGKLK